jgi:hypothetical protein
VAAHDHGSSEACSSMEPPWTSISQDPSIAEVRQVRPPPFPVRMAVALLMMSCLPRGPAVPGFGTTETSTALQVPATYAMGTVCGPETGGEVSLSLLENQTVVLRQVHRDASCTRTATTLFLGRWSVASAGHRLTLDTGPSWLRRFDILDRQTLRMVDSPRPEPSPGIHRSTTPKRLVPFSRPFELRDPLLADGSPLSILFAPLP